MCVTKGVEHVPPELNEVNHRTQSRRRKLKDLCDPEEASRRKQKRIKTTPQESQEKHAARMRIPKNKENCTADAHSKKRIADVYSRK